MKNTDLQRKLKQAEKLLARIAFKKESGSWNEQKVWKLIKDIGWSTKTTDYDKVEKELLSKYSLDEMLEIRDKIGALFRRLALATDSYLEKHKNHSLPFGGDDSFSDMIYHAIGLGKDYYEKAVKDPSIMEDLNPKESFIYCFPHESDYKNKLDPSQRPKFLLDRLKATLAPSMQRLKDVESYQHLHQIKNLIVEMETDVASGKKPKNADYEDKMRKILKEIISEGERKIEEEKRRLEEEIRHLQWWSHLEWSLSSHVGQLDHALDSLDKT